MSASKLEQLQLQQALARRAQLDDDVSQLCCRVRMLCPFLQATDERV